MNRSLPARHTGRQTLGNAEYTNPFAFAARTILACSAPEISEGTEGGAGTGTATAPSTAAGAPPTPNTGASPTAAGQAAAATSLPGARPAAPPNTRQQQQPEARPAAASAPAFVFGAVPASNAAPAAGTGARAAAAAGNAAPASHQQKQEQEHQEQLSFWQSRVQSLPIGDWQQAAGNLLGAASPGIARTPEGAATLAEVARAAWFLHGDATGRLQLPHVSLLCAAMLDACCIFNVAAI